MPGMSAHHISQTVVDRISAKKQTLCRDVLEKLEQETYTWTYFNSMVAILTFYGLTIMRNPVLFLSLFFIGFAIACFSYKFFADENVKGFDPERIEKKLGNVSNKRLRFVEFRPLATSLFILLAFVLLLSYDKSQQHKDHDFTQHVVSLGVEVFSPKALPMKMIEFVCAYPCHESSNYVKVDDNKVLLISLDHIANKSGRESKSFIEQFKYSFTDRRQIRNCFVLGLLGFFTGFVFVLHQDFIECQKMLLQNAQKMPQANGNHPSHPDPPWRTSFGPMDPSQRTYGWSTEVCQKVCMIIKSPKNTMCHFLMSDVSRRFAPARILLIFMVANYVIPTVYACYDVQVPKAPSIRYAIWEMYPTLILCLISPGMWTLLGSVMHLYRCYVPR